MARRSFARPCLLGAFVEHRMSWIIPLEIRWIFGIEWPIVAFIARENRIYRATQQLPQPQICFSRSVGELRRAFSYRTATSAASLGGSVRPVAQRHGGRPCDRGAGRPVARRPGRDGYR